MNKTPAKAKRKTPRKKTTPKQKTRSKKLVSTTNQTKRATQLIDATPNTSWLCPAILEDDGASEWERIVGRLLLTGRLSETEPTAVTAYCRSYETYLTAERWITENGLVTITHDDAGKIKAIAPVPHVVISAKAQSQMRTFLNDCGLTPAAAIRVDTSEEGETVEAKRERIIRGILSGPTG